MNKTPQKSIFSSLEKKTTIWRKAQRGRKFGTLLERNLFSEGGNTFSWWSDFLWGWNK